MDLYLNCYFYAYHFFVLFFYLYKYLVNLMIKTSDSYDWLNKSTYSSSKGEA